MATGVIGAITGIAGSVMGYIAYRRSNRILASDRRLELNKLLNETHVVANGLLDLLPRALASRRVLFGARGGLQSSWSIEFQQQHEQDQEKAEELAASLPPVDSNFAAASFEELDEYLVKLHRTKSLIEALSERYRGTMKEDREYAARSRLRNP